jgi:hypothetical protein
MFKTEPKCIKQKMAAAAALNAIVVKTRVKAGRWGNGD